MQLFQLESCHLRDLHFVDAADDCPSVMAYMSDNDTDTVAVVDSQAPGPDVLIGIVQEKHLLTYFKTPEEKRPFMTVRQITPAVSASCQLDDKIKDVLELMRQTGVDILPIQDDGEIIGVVGIDDLARFIAEKNLIGEPDFGAVFDLEQVAA